MRIARFHTYIIDKMRIALNVLILVKVCIVSLNLKKKHYYMSNDTIPTCV